MDNATRDRTAVDLSLLAVRVVSGVIFAACWVMPMMRRSSGSAKSCTDDGSMISAPPERSRSVLITRG